MPFPETKRIIYERNPLERVICQLRFAPILRIDSEIPSQFQELIRRRFPLYNERNLTRQELVRPVKQKDIPDVADFLSSPALLKSHEFITENNQYQVNLTRTFIALSTTNYERWEVFMEYFRPIIEALIEIYRPPFLTRIGLRYTDIFNRTNLNLGGVGWERLIKPNFLGLLSSSISSSIDSFESVYEINLEDNISKVKIMNSFVLHKPSMEKCYMVDSDFYTSKRINLEDTYNKLEFLHDRATRLIRYIITDELHEAMIPHEIL